MAEDQVINDEYGGADDSEWEYEYHDTETEVTLLLILTCP